MKTMNETDNFDRWFEAQHGPRPHPHGKEAELVARINDGIEARAIMRACDMYDARRKSALYAWTARSMVESRGTQTRGYGSSSSRGLSSDTHERPPTRVSSANDGSVCRLVRR